MLIIWQERFIDFRKGNVNKGKEARKPCVSVTLSSTIWPEFQVQIKKWWETKMEIYVRTT